MKKVMFLAILLLLVPAVYAQLDWSITDLRCGNDKLDEFELCEEGLGNGYCEDLGRILKVASVCDTQHCTCLPRVNKAFCGNNIREGIELCDGDGEDFCAEFGNATGMNLTCNPDTCGCDVVEAVPADYNPVVIDELKNQSQKTAVCGDKKVERDEECDPPNTLCTIGFDESGICTDECKCVPPELFGEEPEEEPDEEPVVVESNGMEERNESGNESMNESVPEIPEEEAEPGFFGKLWAWIVSLFS